jgi:hypothetical protein
MDGEQVQNPDHLEGFGHKGRWVHQPYVSPGFLRMPQRIDDSADAGGVQVWGCFKVQNQEDVPRGKSGLDSVVKLKDGVSALELTFDFQRADFAVLRNVEIQRFPDSSCKKCFTSQCTLVRLQLLQNPPRSSLRQARLDWRNLDAS